MQGDPREHNNDQGGQSMKIKKMMALVTAAAMAFGLAGCGGGNTAATTAAPTEKAEGTTAAEAVTEATEAAKSEGSDNWKVAILTSSSFWKMFHSS